MNEHLDLLLAKTGRRLGEIILSHDSLEARLELKNQECEMLLTENLHLRSEFEGLKLERNRLAQEIFALTPPTTGATLRGKK